MKRIKRFGFTLLELLIVVIVIGILATVALPQFGKFIDRSREAEALSIIETGLTGQFAYFQENGSFTASTSALSTQMPTMKSWTLPGTSPDFTWTVDNTASPRTAEIIADSSGHGHALAADHQIKGIIKSDGTKTLSYKRPGDGSFTNF